jgi:diguanylate cyclase (GGDEF)-like protein
MHQQDTKFNVGESCSEQAEGLRKGNSPKVLVVDDSPEMLNLLTDILTNHRFQVCPASNGNMALRSVAVEMPDLILLDVNLPDMDGYEVCRHLKSDKRSCMIPVIFISGLEEATDKIKGFNAGGVDFISKPFQRTEVLARVETHLTLHCMQKQIEGQNIQLQQEITERKQAEEELKEHKALLEELVSKRTEDLRNINKELEYEITERKNVESVLEQANCKLHSMVYEYGLRHQMIFLFNQMTEKLQACNSPEETNPVIKQFAQKLFPATEGSMFRFDSSRNLFEAAVCWGKALSGKMAFNPEDCLAFREGETHITSNCRSDLCGLPLSRAVGRCSLCIPLSVHGETLGMLHLQQQTSRGSTPGKPEFDEPSEGIDGEVQQLAVTVADHLSLALANIKLRDTLRQQAIHDPLTNLFNRRYMEETLTREIHRAERYGTPLGIIMVDLDHFRRFNNTFGHDAGDLVLKDLGKFLHNNVRKEDVACRYGGEEFTLILPGASLEITQKRAETLRQLVQQLQIYYNNNLLENITLSLGVAIFPVHGSTGEAVLQAADAALYNAKHAGRNRVAVSGNGTSVPCFLRHCLPSEDVRSGGPAEDS